MTTDIPGALPNIHLVSPVANGQWTMPAGDYGNTRYSPLRQDQYQQRAEPACGRHDEHRHSARTRRAARWSWAARLYMVTPFPNNLIALDLTKPGFPQKWIFQPHPDIDVRGHCVLRRRESRRKLMPTEKSSTTHSTSTPSLSMRIPGSGFGRRKWAISTTARPSQWRRSS